VDLDARYPDTPNAEAARASLLSCLVIRRPARGQRRRAGGIFLPARACRDPRFGLPFVAVNKAFSTQFEYQPEEVIGRKAEFLYDSSLQAVALNAQHVIHGDSSPDFRFERLVATRSGRVLDTAVHVTGIPDRESRRYVALYKDVADGYRKERLLLSRAEMFRLMVERSPLPISVQDRNWRLVLVNDAYCEFTGYAKSELLGQDPAVLLHPPEEVTNLPAQREAILNLNVDRFPASSGDSRIDAPRWHSRAFSRLAQLLARPCR
jgi:PAS domain S-box-containing protein